MYTKNKRKYQNKPAQRSAPRSAAPAPKFKNKKEKFLKETLPCIVLLIFMAFWSIGSALSIIDKIKQRDTNTSMITASADSTFVRSYTLNEYLSGTYVNDGDINIYNDDMSLYVNGVGYFQLTSSQGGSIEGDYDTWYDIDIKFAVVNGSQPSDYVIHCQYLIGGGSIANLDSTYRLTSVFRSQYNGPYNTIISLSFLFENNTGLSLRFHLHLRTIEELPFVSITPKTWEIGYDNDYITQLRGQINTLENEVQALQNRVTTLLIDLEASESLRQSEVAELNDEINSLRNTILYAESIIAEKNTTIEQLEARIREITVGNESAYQLGYETGYNDGYGYGYSKGSLNNEYSFTSLISAVVDVPVRTFTSLFDWNLLGINLKQFFLSILSVMAILCAVKLIMR